MLIMRPDTVAFNHGRIGSHFKQIKEVEEVGNKVTSVHYNAISVIIHASIYHTQTEVKCKLFDC